MGWGGSAGPHQSLADTLHLTYFNIYVCMYVVYSGQIAQVVERQTADPWVAGSSLTTGEKCKNS